MSSRAVRRIALGLLIGTLVVIVACIPALIDTWDVANEGEWGFRGFGLVAATVFALAGALLALKRPENPVGWLFGLVGAALGLNTAGEFYGVFPMIEGIDSGIRYQVAWWTSWSWVGFLGLIAFAILLFPSGRLPTPRWRLGAWFMAAAFVLGCTSFAIYPGPLNNMPERITNRYALPPGAGTEVFFNGAMLVFLSALVLAVVGIVQRFRASRGLQRQQMKFFALAAASLGGSMVLVVFSQLLVPQLAEFAEIWSSLAILSVPVAMTFAILRYRLYDIDLIINRAIVYGALSGVLASVYLGGVVLLQQLLSPLTADSDAAVAASTLAVAGLFRPLRAQIQRFIDRRFYRRKYDAAAALSDFAARLRDHVDLDALRKELLRAAGSTVQPAHASLWLKPAELGDRR